MSLIKTLEDDLKIKGSMTLDELAIWCKEHCYKISHAERRLRPSECNWVETIRNSKRAIIGYKFREEESQFVKEMREIREKAMREREENVKVKQLLTNQPAML